MKSFRIFILFITTLSFSQKIETKLGPGINLNDENINQVFNLWKNYLASNPDTIFDNPYWNESEKKKYKSYDLLKSEGFLSPSLYGLDPLNMVLYIKEFGNDYLIHSMYYWTGDDQTINPLAITDVIAKKENGIFKLFNYMPHQTRDWKRNKVGIINYYYTNNYPFDLLTAQKANEFIGKVSKYFDLDIKSIDYYIASDCDGVHKMKGFDYVIGMGNTSNLCAFFDVYNQIVYTNVRYGENHKHELIHLINTKYTNAHELLLSGLSVYTSDRYCHMGQPFVYYISLINKYLEKNKETNLSDLNNLPQMSGIDSYYFVGALLADIILEKGGVELLKEALTVGKEEDDLLAFFQSKLKINKIALNELLKKRFREIDKNQKMNFRLDY